MKRTSKGTKKYPLTYIRTLGTIVLIAFLVIVPVMFWFLVGPSASQRALPKTPTDAVMVIAFRQDGVAMSGFVLRDCDIAACGTLLSSRLMRFTDDVLNQGITYVGWCRTTQNTPPILSRDEMGWHAENLNLTKAPWLYRLRRNSESHWVLDAKNSSDDVWVTCPESSNAHKDLSWPLSVALLLSIHPKWSDATSEMTTEALFMKACSVSESMRADQELLPKTFGPFTPKVAPETYLNDDASTWGKTPSRPTAPTAAGNQRDE